MTTRGDDERDDKGGQPAEAVVANLQPKKTRIGPPPPPPPIATIEPAAPPTPPPIEIRPSGLVGAAVADPEEHTPLNIEPTIVREGARALTVDSMDIVLSDETEQLKEGFDETGGDEEPRGEGPAGVLESVLPEAPAAVLQLEDADSVVEPDIVHERPSEPRLTASADTILTSLHAFLEQELDHSDAEDRRLRAMLLYEMGHLEELVYRDNERSLRRYELAREQDDGFVPTLRALRRRYADADRWSDYAGVLQAEVEVCRSERERAMLLALLGEAQWRRLDQTDIAVENLQAALTLVPRNRRALEVLRAIFSETHRWEDLLAVLRQMANVTTDGEERARLTVDMAEICELRLGNANDGEELYAQALDLDPSNEKALVSLRRLYLLHRRWQRLSELLAREAGEEYEPGEMFADLYRAARIAQTHLHDDARSASLLETAAALRPSDALPLQALVEVYQRTGRSEDLAAALSRLTRLAREPTLRADLLFRLGQLHQDWLGRPEKALEIYRQALKEQPGHEATLRVIAELYTRLECWEDLLDVELLRAERHREAAARADGYLKAARICERELKDMPRAVELYERAWRTVRGRLEAFRALDRIYRQVGRWDALAELCEERAAQTSDVGLSAALLREAASIYEERLDQREKAVVALEQLREAQPLDRQALMHLSRLYELDGRVERLRRTLEEWAELSKDPEERAELRRRLAELLEHTLRQPEAAAAIYREMLTRRSDDHVARERLKAIYDHTGRWNDLVDTLRSELEMLATPPEEAAVLVQIGRLSEEKLGNVQQAQWAYEQALSRDPHCTPAAIALEDLLRRTEGWEPLVELMRQQAEAAREPGLASAALCRAAEVCEERLDALDRAIEMYTRALDLDAHNEPARHGLERIYLKQDDFAALESHYLREAEESSNPQLRVRAYLRLAALFDRGSEQSDAAAAADAHEAALRVTADQPDALHGLAALCRRRGQWQRLAQLLGQVAAGADDRESALAALKEWAAIIESHPSEQWDPTPIYERVLDGDPQDPHAVAALERLAYERGDGDSLIRLAMLQVESHSDKNLLAALCMRAALISVASSRQAEAIELLRRGLAALPRYLPAIRLLRRLQEQQGNFADVAELLLLEAQQVSSDTARHAALYRAAVVRLDQLNDISGAQLALEQIVAADPRHTQAFERLASILRVREQWGALAELYRRRLAVLELAARMPVQLELAALYRDRLEDPNAAIQLLSELLAHQSEMGTALQQMAELCVTQGRWREAEEYLGRLAAAVKEDPDLRREAFFAGSTYSANVWVKRTVRSMRCTSC